MNEDGCFSWITSDSILNAGVRLCKIHLKADSELLYTLNVAVICDIYCEAPVNRGRRRYFQYSKIYIQLEVIGCSKNGMY